MVERCYLVIFSVIDFCDASVDEVPTNLTLMVWVPFVSLLVKVTVALPAESTRPVPTFVDPS